MTAVPYPRPLPRPSLIRPVTLLALLALITLLVGLVLPLAAPMPAPLPPTLTGLPYARTDSNVFIENRGQFADDLVAAMLAPKAQLGVGRDGRLHLAVTGAPPVTLTFYSNRFTPQPQVMLTGPLATRVSFLTGDNTDRHQADVPVWAGVRIAGLIPRLALELTVEDGRLRLRAAPDGAPNLGAVRLRVEGATVVGISDGTLEVQAGEHRLRLPLLEMDSGSAATLQAPTPTVLAQQEVGAPFAPPGAAGWAHSSAAPASVAHLLAASTFLGGSAGEDVGALTLDGQGNVYVAGKTGTDSFPTTPGAYDLTYNGSDDAFVAKLSNDLTTLIAASFLGGTSWDEATALALDGQGNVYVAGQTGSANFPTTPWAYDRTYNGSLCDTFVAKLSSDLTTLRASTFLGGRDRDFATAIALDVQGNVHVVGQTESANFPTTPGAYDRTHNGEYEYDTFVAKLSGDLTTLTAATFLGGNGWDEATNLALDAQGNVYVVGRTESANFPTTPGAYDTTYNGGSNFGDDAFVAKLSSDLTTLTAATFLGGSSWDEAATLAFDRQGNVYVAGRSSSANFPTTPGSFDSTFSGSSDAFIAKLSGDLTTLTAATFLGGSYGTDEATTLAINTGGDVYVAGKTNAANFPTTTGAFDPTYNGNDDVFVAMLSGDLTVLIAATFLGGNDSDKAATLALDSQGNVYVVGQTKSADFPTTPGAYDRTYNGGGDTFVVNLQLSFTFAKTAPAKSAIGQPDSLTLQWQSAGATVHHYRYCIATTAGCTPTTNAGTSTIVSVSDLTPGTAYYWQVRACANSECTVYADADNGQHHFFTVALPGTAYVFLPLLVKPEIFIPVSSVLTPFDANTSDLGGPYSWSSNYGTTPEIIVASNGVTLDVLAQDYNADTPWKAVLLRIEPRANGYRVTQALTDLPMLDRIMGLAIDKAGNRYYATCVDESSRITPYYPPPKTYRSDIVRVVKVDAAGNVLFNVDLDTARYAFDNRAEMIINPMVASTARLAVGGNEVALVHGINTGPDWNINGTRHQKALSTRLDATHGTILLTSSVWVSHSFDQRLLYDGDDIIEYHLGDAYPRYIVFGRNRESYPIFHIKGNLGENNTYTRLGNIALIEHDPNYKYIALFATENNAVTDNYINGPRNLAIVRVRRGDYSIDPNLPDTLTVVSVRRQYTNRLKWLTNYSAESNLHAERPKLVSIGNDRYIVLWEEWHHTGGNKEVFNGVYGMVINANGDIIRPARLLTNAYHLHRSDDAFMLNNRAAWMTGDAAARKLYLHLVDESLNYQRVTLD